MVLGADRRSSVSQVLREGLWLVGAGTVAGGGIIVLGCCTLLACAVPARRAATIEPAAALREP